MARALLSDCTKADQRTAAFVRLNKYSMLGSVLGPCVGGLLAEPNLRLPEGLRMGIFDRFPFLLPCACCCMLAVATFLVVCVYAEDPRKESPLLGPATAPAHPLSQLRANSAFLSAVFTWSLCAYTGSMFVELLGLWCKTAIDSGGLGWREEWKVSVVLVTGSIALILFLSTALRPLITRYGTSTVLRLSLFLVMLDFLLVPLISSLPSALVWPCILLASPLWCLASGSCITSINIIINSVVPQELYGAANGLGISLVALIRAFGPVTAGALLGWSIAEARPYPLDRCLPFYVAAAVTAANLVFLRRSNLV